MHVGESGGFLPRTLNQSLGPGCKDSLNLAPRPSPPTAEHSQIHKVSAWCPRVSRSLALPSAHVGRKVPVPQEEYGLRPCREGKSILLLRFRLLVWEAEVDR